MGQSPENDNLVMESIEDLFNQADLLVDDQTRAKAALHRQLARTMPIIGSLPLRPADERLPDDTDSLVLAGMKHSAMMPLGLHSGAPKAAADRQSSPGSINPAAAEKNPAMPAQTQEDNDGPQTETAADNPFLAIRQAIISAGAESPDEPPAHARQTENRAAGSPSNGFSAQLAQLIDSEIARQLDARLQSREHNRAKNSTRAKAGVKNTASAKPSPAKKQPAGKRQAQERKEAAEKKRGPEKKQSPKLKQGPKKKSASKKNQSAGKKPPLAAKKLVKGKQAGKRAAAEQVKPK